MPSTRSRLTTTTTRKISTWNNLHSTHHLSTLSSMPIIIRGWDCLRVIIFRLLIKGMQKGIMGRLRMGIRIIDRSPRPMIRSFLAMRWALMMISQSLLWMIYRWRLLSRRKISMKKHQNPSQPKPRLNRMLSTSLETILSNPHKTSRKPNPLKNPSQP